ncbi:MAG: molecular chaperone HtpG [Bacteroidales bacterium]|nr:molecular chaperone HtpG [Bacteroidales bacterium]
MKGKIGVTTENIFPIIKKFLYSDQEIFLRELISNAIDATEKLKVLARKGEYKGDVGNKKIYVKVDKKNKQIIVSDFGIGMTEEEVNQYINQIAFSSAEEFLSKYKDEVNLIGHFGLGFYSAFIVANKVELITKSYKEGAKAVKWICEGTPEFEIKEAERSEHGTDVILHITDETYKEFLEEDKIEELLNKYCKFLPIPIVFGKKKEFKDGKLVETDEDYIINNTNPLWLQKPQNLKDEDYKKFYKELYPREFEEPMFHIHLNIDYPFNLTGILYFPKITSPFDIQKRKIQLYCKQVFVTDNIEGIVPDYLTLLHGVIDSPDIPLNVSRSYLQNDPEVKKISSHITKKVADKLNDIYKDNRADFEKKWEDLKLFIQYGMISDEKFYDRAIAFALFKNTENKYFTLEEYKKLIESNQKDKYKNIVVLYTTDTEKQYTYIQRAKNKGYDVLVLDGHLDIAFINHLETKEKNLIFKRVDSDILEKLIEKDDTQKTQFSEIEQENFRYAVFAILPDKEKFLVSFEPVADSEMPALITQSEYIRRMKDMSQFSPSHIYRNVSDLFNFVVNTNHDLIKKINSELHETLKKQLEPLQQKIDSLKKELEELRKKYDENKTVIEEKDKELESIINEKKKIITDYAQQNDLLSQIIDIALLSHNLLKHERFENFLKRSIKLLEKN